METFLFTSESVNEGHPDKQLCDQVSDATLHACLEQDPESRVACETGTKTNMGMVLGEITTSAKVDYKKTVRSPYRVIEVVSAIDETPVLMPLTHALVTKLAAKITEVRKNKNCPWPDGKTHHDGGL